MGKNGRVFVKISIDELKNICKEKNLFDEYGYMNKTSKMEKDLAKVQFGDENVYYNEKDAHIYSEELLGYHTLENGLTFLGVRSSGDWEYPIFYIIYYDGKDLRAYIPSDGNAWNKDTKYAFGNEDENGEELSDHNYLKKYCHENHIQIPDFVNEVDCWIEPDDKFLENILVNPEKIKQDIIKRLIPV